MKRERVKQIGRAKEKGGEKARAKERKRESARIQTIGTGGLCFSHNEEEGGGRGEGHERGNMGEVGNRGYVNYVRSYFRNHTLTQYMMPTHTSETHSFPLAACPLPTANLHHLHPISTYLHPSSIFTRCKDTLWRIRPVYRMLPEEAKNPDCGLGGRGCCRANFRYYNI